MAVSGGSEYRHPPDMIFSLKGVQGVAGMTGVDGSGAVLLETGRLRLRRFTEADADALTELDSDPEVMRYLTGGQPTPADVVRGELLPRLLAGYDRCPGLGRWAAVDRATGTFLGWFALDAPAAEPSPGAAAPQAGVRPEAGPPAAEPVPGAGAPEAEPVPGADAPQAGPLPGPAAGAAPPAAAPPAAAPPAAAPPAAAPPAAAPPAAAPPAAAPPAAAPPAGAQPAAAQPVTQAELGYRLRRAAWGRGLATEGSRALLRYAFATVGLARVWAQTMAVNTPSRRVMEKSGLRYVRTFHLDWADPIEGTEHGEVEYELLRAEWAAREAG